MMTMRCKVKLKSLTEAYNKGIAAEFVPVNGNSPENNQFYAATPDGSLKLTLSEKAAKILDTYKLGNEYYVDFVPVNTNQSDCQ